MVISLRLELYIKLLPLQNFSKLMGYKIGIFQYRKLMTRESPIKSFPLLQIALIQRSHLRFNRTHSYCSYGYACPHTQSPVNIQTNSIIKLGQGLNPLCMNYKLGDYMGINNGYTAKFFPLGSLKNSCVLSGGPIEKGYKFKLLEFHFHWGKNDNNGSEHSLDGKKFPSELHLVHWNSSLYSSPDEAIKLPYGMVVLSSFIQQNDENLEKFSQLIDCHKKIKYKYDSAILHGFDINTFFSYDLNFYAYPGSLTTDPFISNVFWIILKQFTTINKELTGSFRGLLRVTKEQAEKENDENYYRITNNTRPIMELYDRKIIVSSD